MNWRTKRHRDKLAQYQYFLNHQFCEVCGKPAMQVHEILYKSQMGKCTDDNMISLCLDGHDRAHFKKKPYLRKEDLLRIKEREVVGVVHI